MSPHMNLMDAIEKVASDPESKVFQPEAYGLALTLSVFFIMLGASQIIAPAWNYINYRIFPRAKHRSVIEIILIWIFAILVMAWASAMVAKHIDSEEQRRSGVSTGGRESEFVREARQHREEQIGQAEEEERRARQEQARVQRQPRPVGVPIPTTPQHFEVVWRFKTGGPIRSEPIIADDTVYVASTDSVVYALNTRTSGLKWSYVTEVGRTTTWAQREAELRALERKVTFGPNTDAKRKRLSYRIKLAADRDTVCLTQGSRVYGIDARTGKELWVREIAPPPQPTNVSDMTKVISTIPRMPLAGILSRPVVGLGMVFVTMNGDLYALCTDKNEMLWTYPCDKSSETMNRGSVFFYWTEPAVAGDAVYFAAGRKFYVVEAATGKPQTIFDLPNMGVFDEFLAAHEHTAFICEIVKQQSGPNTDIYGERRMLEAIDVNTQKVSWSYPYGLPPSIAGGRVYCMNAAGAVLAMDAESGREVSIHHSHLGVTGLVAAGANLTYFGVGRVLIRDETGTRGGVKYSIGSPGFPHGLLCAMDHDKDQLRALTLFPGMSISTPLVVAGTHVIFGSEDSYVYCVEVRDGSKLLAQTQQGMPSEPSGQVPPSTSDTRDGP